jgi:hypothetical protein
MPGIRRRESMRFFGSIPAAIIAALANPAGAQTGAGADRNSLSVYVQVSDARFDSYLLVRKNKPGIGEDDTSEEFFYIPPFDSKDRAREFADWRRKFHLIVSAAALSEGVQPKIAHVKDEFSLADRAAECWTVDHDKERRITITIIGSADEATIENEYQAASRDFFADPRSFTCKYKVRSSTAEP